MAQQVFAFVVTVPAGTATASPITQDISFDQATVTTVEIIIPDGHAGFTGIALAQAQQQIIPQNVGGWIISNDEKLVLDIQDYLDNGNWQALAYNLDVYDHNFYVRFLCSDIAPAAAAPVDAAAVGFATGAAAQPAAAVTGVAGDPGNLGYGV